MLAVIIILIVGVPVVVYMIKSRHRRNNVAVLQDYKRRKKRRQPAEGAVSSPHHGTEGKKCSHCRKEAKHLTFYADDNGTVIGLCSACKPIAKRRDLMPL
ncbi:hypothetical protein GCM10010911_00450 [Paenibacillus nasutitermitis]|uniref:Uncharacterized protein n=2 Tax=Paenibacillus nasutitermitis TaxID=1652958 RepID=A0A916YIM6_9BACL|nr:hypothetical protein GCM10010911_00450 [Paenibacillus nasutitermitis]